MPPEQHEDEAYRGLEVGLRSNRAKRNTAGPIDPQSQWESAAPAAAAPRARRNLMSNPEFRAGRLKFTDPITLTDADLSDRPWLVSSWLPLRNVTMLSGDGGVGKTLLAQMLATSCAIGRDWLGKPTMPVRSLLVFCEDDEDEIRRRQRDINEYLGCAWGDLENLKWISRVGDDNSLMAWPEREASGQPTPFFQQLHNESQDFAARLVVMDSLHDLFPGNENSRPQARQFVQLLASMARDCDGAVLLNAHPSVAGRTTGSGESGSTAWNNAVRSRLYLTRPGGKSDEAAELDRDARVLKRMKSNYSGVGDEIRLRWREGVFVHDQPLTGAAAAIEDRRAERAFLACLDITTAQGRYVTDSAQSTSRFAPRLFQAMREAEGFRAKQLTQAMNALFASGLIRIDTVRGADRHPQKAIVRSAGHVAAGTAGTADE